MSILNLMNTNTSTTSTNEALPMNTIKTTDMNTNALSSTISAHLFHHIGQARIAVIIACCVVDAAKLVGDLEMPEAFLDLVEQSLDTAKLETTVSGEGAITKTIHALVLPMKDVKDALVATQMCTEEGTMGTRLIEMMEQRTEAYAPTKVGDTFTRRFPNFGIEKGQMGNLAKESVYAQEASQMTVDEMVRSWANDIQTALGGAEKDDEAYVLAGCNAMSAENAYTSEFKADRRQRTYQAACHGPNGQASDRSRALMNLAGVSLDYDVATVKEAIKAEVMDMVNVGASQVGKLMAESNKDPVAFIMKELAKPKNERDVAKPWSFAKAAVIWAELMKGNKPYIGMAVGLDAKCSGPQLGALMVGDQEIAAACGMTLVQLKDAYVRCIDLLVKAGFVEIKRSDIKKAFMGIFYGQGWAAFTDTKQLTKDEQFGLIAMLYPDGVVSDDIAKKFHKVVSSSFGAKMVALRNRIKEYQGNMTGRSGHMMPDGSKVQMNYKVKHNILDQAIEHDVVCPDVTVTTGEFTYKFIKLALNTTTVHTSDFVRNAFVNMIQATDSLIARLIVVHLSRGCTVDGVVFEPAQHIIAVHDCFRVNVTEMHLLRQAIKNAYMDLFGSRTNIKTKDMPLGTDILGLFFEGMQKAVTNPECKVVPMPQFLKLKTGEIRKMTKINGVAVTDIIEQLGTSYYFDK